MDPYIILGVNRNDDFKMIRKKYFKMCKLYHPDKAESGDDLKERTRMFQLLQLSFETIQKEKNIGNNVYTDDNNVNIEISSEKIKEVIDNVCELVGEKIKSFTSHPLYRIISSVGIRAAMNIFRTSPNHFSLLDIQCSYIDIINKAKLKCDYTRITSNGEKETINVDEQIIYPYMIIPEKGDYNEKENKYKDLVVRVSLEDKDEIELDYKNYILRIKNGDIILNHQEDEKDFSELKFFTQYGEFVVQF